MGNKKGKSDILLKVTRKVKSLKTLELRNLLNFYIETQNARHTTPEWANQQKLRPEKWYTTYWQGPLGLPKNAFGQI